MLSHQIPINLRKELFRRIPINLQHLSFINKAVLDVASALFRTSFITLITAELIFFFKKGICRLGSHYRNYRCLLRFYWLCHVAMTTPQRSVVGLMKVSLCYMIQNFTINNLAFSIPSDLNELLLTLSISATAVCVLAYLTISELVIMETKLSILNGRRFQKWGGRNIVVSRLHVGVQAAFSLSELKVASISKRPCSPHSEDPWLSGRNPV